MNFYSFSLKVLVVLIGTSVLFSCQPSENESLSDFEMLQMKLKDDLHYQAYIKANKAIYTSTIENKIDWSGINEFMQGNGKTDICDCDKEQLNTIKGALNYKQIHCNESKPNFVEFYRKNKEELEALNVFQTKKLFSHSTTIASARASCLDALNVDLAAVIPDCNQSIEDNPYEWSIWECIDSGTNSAYIMYDICICDNYGYC